MAEKHGSVPRHLESEKSKTDMIVVVEFHFMLQAFTDIVVRDSELVTVELVASDRNGDLQGVVFLGSIKYDALKRVYDSRVSINPSAL